MKKIDAIIGLLLLTACGHKKDSSQNSVPTIKTEDRKKAEELVSDAEVTCISQGECSESVAMLSIVQQTSAHTGVGQCTGFLVSSDILATNAHCIPENVRSHADTCDQGAIRAHFPKVDELPAFSIVCAQLLDISSTQTQDGEMSLGQDYAFIRLESPVTQRKVLEISRAGFSDGEMLWAQTVNPTSPTQVRGELERKSCRVTQNTVVIPQFVEKYFPILTLTECDVIEGNSGSPIIDASSRSRGIIQARLTDEGRESLKKYMTESGENLGIGTNWSCVSVPSLPGDLPHPSSCSTKTVQGFSGQAIGGMPNLAQSLSEEVESLLQDFLHASPASADPFRWKAQGFSEKYSTEIEIIPAPKCYHSNTLESWMQNHPSMENMEFENVPARTVTLHLNARYQPSFRVKSRSEYTLSLQLPDVGDVRAQSTFSSDLQYRGGFSLFSTGDHEASLKIPACH